MTNEEWLSTFSIEGKAKFLARSCNFCSYDCDNDYCPENRCENGIKEWLNEKHIEPMPEIKAGDYIVYEKDHCLCRAVCVYGNIVYRIDRGGCCNYGGEMQEKTISIKRYNVATGTLEDIWRADNEN